MFMQKEMLSDIQSSMKVKQNSLVPMGTAGRALRKEKEGHKGYRKLSSNQFSKNSISTDKW